MGRVTKLSGLIGKIKDKASQSKAALLAKPNTASFHLALLKATTHDPSSPINDAHLSVLLSFGKTSRVTAAAAVNLLMDRLQKTQSSAVAVKCLVAVHHIVKNGGFILRDQLSVFPTTGGRNYLKLSDFRDGSNPVSWELSSWVRWYAQYVETLLSTSRVLGFFVSDERESDRVSDRVSASLDSDLLRETESLVDLLEQSCRKPNYLQNGNKLVDKIVGLVGEDQRAAVREISVRVSEFQERVSGLSFGESVELVCALKRLENCREKQLDNCEKYEILMDRFWCLVMETKSMVGGRSEKNRLCGELVASFRSRMSESARFKERVLFTDDSVRFGSARYDLSEKQFPVVDLTGPYILI